MRKERILQPRNQNTFASREDARFHHTEGLPPKRKTTSTQALPKMFDRTVTEDLTTFVG